MIACLDVHYFRDFATAAAVVFQDWESCSSASEYTATIPQPEEYEPGRFYLRELRPLIAVVKEIAEPIDVYVIDGYCHLSSDLSPGLGAYLKQSIDPTASIVGVAKNRYRDTRHAAELLRGGSTRPLFVTAIGAAYEAASQHVASMAGEYRIPTMLKAVDRLARTQAKSEQQYRGGGGSNLGANSE
jgi:deoxyribonuclease V